MKRSEINRERTSQRAEQQAGVSPDLFSFLTGFAGFLGLTGKSICQQTEFFDIIKKIEIPQRGRIRCTNVAFKKQTSPSELVSVSFLTANHGKP